MSFRFSNPAADFTTEAFVLEPAKVDLKIVGIKLRTFTDENTGEITGGIVNFMLRVASGEHKDKMVSPYAAWFQDDGSNPDLMRMALASLGIKPGTKAADAEFKSQYPDIDLSFAEDTEHKPAEGWSKVIGNIITANVEKKWSTKMERYENVYKGIRPLEVA